MSLHPEERETTVTSTDADQLIRIWSAQRRFITKMRRNPNFTEVKSGTYGRSVFAEFTIPADRWNPATGAKRRSSALGRVNNLKVTKSQPADSAGDGDGR